MALFQPLKDFGVVGIGDGSGKDWSFPPGVNDAGQPLVYKIPDHLAVIWEGYGWGKIVVQETKFAEQTVLVVPQVIVPLSAMPAAAPAPSPAPPVAEAPAPQSEPAPTPAKGTLQLKK